MSSSPVDKSAPRFRPRNFEPTDEQRRIQTATQRFVIAMANAGAAKTSTLALRAAESLSRGTAARDILALTFTREAAAVLRVRMLEMGILRPAVDSIRIATFDDFARDVLSEIEGAGTPALGTFEEVAPHVLAAVRRAEEQNADRSEPLELLFPTHNEQIAEFLKIARRLKARLSPYSLDEGESRASAAASLGLDLSTWILFRTLESVRSTGDGGHHWRGEFDATYDLACRLTEQAETIQRLPAYRVILVDELQDMNAATYAFLCALISRGRSFFTGAGDLDQVILGWAGAEAAFLTEAFPRDFPGLVRLPLTRTFRHGAEMAELTARFKRKVVESGRNEPAQILLDAYPAGDADACAAGVVASIVRWSAQTGGLADCAVLLRSPHQSIAIENALFDAGIGWRTSGLNSYLERPEVLMIRGLIAIALHAHDSIPGKARRLRVLQALAFWRELPMGETRQRDLEIAAEQPALFEEYFKGQLIRAQTRADIAAAGMSEEEATEASQRRLDHAARLRREGRATEALALLEDSAAAEVVETAQHARIRERFRMTVDYLANQADKRPAGELLQGAFQILDLGTAAHRLYVDPVNAESVARSIAGFIRFATASKLELAGFAKRLHAIETRLDALRKRDTVLLATVDAAKGSEYRHVILPFLETGEFPLAHAELAEEENRYYVAITRMRDRLSLWAPEGPRRSRFVDATQIKSATAKGRAIAAHAGHWDSGTN